MHKIDLSIIIPYYNTYNLTCLLLDELQKQIKSNVEIILIDDGCYETRLDNYHFVKIFHLPENKGASYAWNYGIERACGRYIGFIDSDDMIAHDYISTLLDTIKTHTEEEIIFGGKDSTTGHEVSNPQNIAIGKAIYRKDFCPRFNEQGKYRTDVPFHRQVVEHLHRKYLIPKILYYYNSNREGSLTGRRLHEEKLWQPPKS